MPQGDWWQELAEKVREFPQGDLTSWGIPFVVPDAPLVVAQGMDEIRIPMRGKADYICFLHDWLQDPASARPTSGGSLGSPESTFCPSFVTWTLSASPPGSTKTDVCRPSFRKGGEPLTLPSRSNEVRSAADTIRLTLVCSHRTMDMR